MDFLTVFSAVLSAEICKMIIERYLKSKIEKTFDTIDETVRPKDGGGNNDSDIF